MATALLLIASAATYNPRRLCITAQKRGTSTEEVLFLFHSSQSLQILFQAFPIVLPRSELSGILTAPSGQRHSDLIHS
jgi:hypothetical protein